MQTSGEPVLWLCVFSRRAGVLYFHVEGYDSPLLSTVVWSWFFMLGFLAGLMLVGHYLGLFCAPQSYRNPNYRRFERFLENVNARLLG